MTKAKTAPTQELVINQQNETQLARKNWVNFESDTFVMNKSVDGTETEATLDFSGGWSPGEVNLQFAINPKGKKVIITAESWIAFRSRVDNIVLHCQRMLAFESFELTYSLLTGPNQSYHKVLKLNKADAIETIARDGSFNTFIVEASRKLKLQGLALAGYFNDWRNYYRQVS